MVYKCGQGRSKLVLSIMPIFKDSLCLEMTWIISNWSFKQDLILK